MAQRRLRTEELPPTLATATGAPHIVEPSGHPGAPTAARLFAWGSSKQETRDCKGIKILLAICPSSHGREDYLPESVVSWNLSCVSFLLSLFLLSQFPAQRASCHFPCTGFSLCSASTVEALTELGFCCAWPLTRGGQAEIVSARLNLSCGTTYVGGVCNFLGSFLPQQKFEVGDGPVL